MKKIKFLSIISLFSFPQGAFSPVHIYTPAEVQDIIEHARLRGIRTIPEFDTPGHVAALGRALPRTDSFFKSLYFVKFCIEELITDCYNGSTPRVAIYGVHAAREILDPTNPEVYEFMRKLLTEVKQVFRFEPYIHLGMDEVYPACW